MLQFVFKFGNYIMPLDQNAHLNINNEMMLTILRDFKSLQEIVGTFQRDPMLIRRALLAGADVPILHRITPSQILLRDSWFHYNESKKRFVLFLYSTLPEVRDDQSDDSDIELKKLLHKTVSQYELRYTIESFIIIRKISNGFEYKIYGFDKQKTCTSKTGTKQLISEPHLNANVILARMVSLAQYVCHSVATAPTDMQIFLNKTDMAMQRLMSVISGNEYQEILQNLCRAFNPLLDNDQKTTAQFAMRILEMTYEKQVITQKKHSKLYHFFAVSNTVNKLAAVKEYRERGATLRLAAKEGLLGKLVSADQAASASHASNGASNS